MIPPLPFDPNVDYSAPTGVNKPPTKSATLAKPFLPIASRHVQDLNPQSNVVTQASAAGLPAVVRLLQQIADSTAKMASGYKAPGTEGDKGGDEEKKKKPQQYVTERAAQALQAFNGQMSRFSQIASAPFDGVNKLIGTIQGNIGSLVGKFNPVALKQFTFAADDLQATIGEILMPLLNNFTQVIRSIGSGFNTLNGPAKVFLVALSAAAVGFAVATIAVEVLSVALNSLTAGIPAVLGAVAGALGGAFLAMKDAPQVKATFDRLVAAIVAIANALGKALMPILIALAPVFEKMMVGFAEDLTVIAEVIEDLEPLIKLFAELLGLLAEAFGSVAHTVADLLKMLGYEGTKVNLNPNDGKAVRSTSIGGVSDFINKAYTSAFSMGTKDTTKENVSNINENVAGIATWLREVGPGAVEFFTTWKNVMGGNITKAADMSLLVSTMERLNGMIIGGK